MVQQVHLKRIKPKQFWQQYISRREPVVINELDYQWEAFTVEFLASKAGESTVMVEHRSNAKDTFGQGKKFPMLFGDFIKALEEGNSSLYMSTQEVGVGRDGHPLLLGPPLLQLQGHFPHQQPLMGNLIPQSINMWMGCAPEGSSSGLHHDYHDNLYVLLRGRKRFRLYPPSAAPDMYVRGKLKKIYPNGRIVYEGQGDILPDGSDLHDVRLWEARHAADTAAAASDDVDAADAALEQQLEAMLDEEACFGADGGLADDYIDSDGESSELSDSDVPSDRFEGFEGAELGLGKHSKRKGLLQDSKPSKKHKAGQTTAQGSKTSSKPTTDKSGRPQVMKAAAGGAVAAAAPEAAPVSFSQVDLGLPAAELRRRYPRFPGVAAAQEVMLEAGQMLYLPAGWFHEVTSFGGAGHDGGHLAINYWYHPPDNLDSSKAGFKQPYTSPYYPTIWAERQPWLQQDTERWWQQQQQQRQQQLGLKGPSPGAAQQAAAGPQQLRVKVPDSTSRHIQWSEGAHSPTNKYRMSMTRQGTATGDASKKPSDCQENRPACGMINTADSDGGSDTDSPCSSRDHTVAVETAAGKPNNSSKASHARHSRSSPPPGSDECSLRHVSAPAGHNSPRDELPTQLTAALEGGSEDQVHSKGSRGVQQQPTKQQQKQVHSKGSRGVQQQPDSSNEDAGDQEDGVSEEVLAAMKAVEDYFGGNPEAARQLLSEFMAQRKQRLANCGGNAERTIALPILFGRRHHYAVAVKVVPRKPARR